MHSKNISQKVRAVLKNKGESGVSLANNVPYGYKKDENGKTKWVIDEPSAKVVREIFALFVQGYGTCEIAEQLRANRKKYAKSGKKSIFSGLLFCSDCDQKMYFQSPVTDLKAKDHYRCSSYKHDTKTCTSHYISDDVLQSLVLENIQRTIAYLKKYEDFFVKE